MNPNFCLSSLGLTSKGSFGSIPIFSGLQSSRHLLMTLIFLFRHRGSLAGAHDFDLFKKALDCAIWMGVHYKNSKHVASSQTLIGGLAVIMVKLSLCSDFKARVSSSVMLSPWVINACLPLHSVGLSTS
ncbi:hypothetical protein NC653_031950 [Populus alba x Populus x berolinensis]|uniref:Uncharacterized protein n=2 Tax=Populus TaxID=3689 RepID=A0A4U5R0Q7_POPAL|nr:hypothetical protein NC653_031950 [Populus alba x Populus x berolinensis]TKS17252.1 hypothetical protein D5086_0000015350 [Populus alba]